MKRTLLFSLAFVSASVLLAQQEGKKYATMNSKEGICWHMSQKMAKRMMGFSPAATEAKFPSVALHQGDLSSMGRRSIVVWHQAKVMDSCLFSAGNAMLKK